MNRPRLLAPVFLLAPPRSGGQLLFEWLSTLSELSPLTDWPEESGDLEEALYRRLHHHDQRLLVYDERMVSSSVQLAARFPDARFVWSYREPVDAIAAVVEEGVAADEAVQRWDGSMSLILDALDGIVSGRSLAARYDALLQDERELDRVCAFLGVARPRVSAVPLPSEERHRSAVEPFLPRIAATAERARAKLAGSSAVDSPASAPIAFADAFRSISTASFPEILHALGISLVVTTYQSGKVVLVRAPDRTTLNTHVRTLPTPMGVAAAPNVLSIGTKREIVEFHNQPAVAARLDPPNVNDVVLVPRNVHITGDIRIHEMAYVRGELWVVNTLFSALCTIDGPHSFVPRWRPPFITELVPEDRCHLNGLAVEGDCIRYVSAFGETDSAGGWREDKCAGIVIDVESGKTVLRGLSMPHSPRLYDGRFWILESGRGTLAAADLHRGEIETIVELPGFTRGLAFAQQFAFVGLSQVRESNVFGGIPLVDRVKERRCGVWVIDLRTRQIAAFLQFEGIVHEIFDVQVLFGARFPELLDITDERVGSTYVLPTEAFRE